MASDGAGRCPEVEVMAPLVGLADFHACVMLLGKLYNVKTSHSKISLATRCAERSGAEGTMKIAQ